MSISQSTFAQTTLFLAAIALIEVATPTSILADERPCSELWAELASAPEPGGSPEYRKYSRAASSQREQIMIARRQARDIGCGFYAQAGRPGCAPINAEIERMERNLASLQHRRAELAREESRRPNRTRILAALNANNCGDPRLATREESLRASPEERIPSGGDQQRAWRIVTESRPTSAQENFGTSAPGEGSDANSPAKNFTIIAGNPPAKEPLAKHLATEPPTAEDHADPLGLATVSPAEERQAVLPESQDAPSPSVLDVLVPAEEAGILTGPTDTQKAAAPAPEDQPAERTDELTTGSAPSADAIPHDPEQRKVRVVGPTFLPDPEGAIDLRAPVRKQAR